MSKPEGHEPRHPPDASHTAAMTGPAFLVEWDPAWETYDAEEVRPYAITGGRTRPQHSMRLVTLLKAEETARVQGVGPESARAVELCRDQPRSVAEIAARLGLPVQATKIVLSDLIDCGALVIALPGPGVSDHLQVLEALRSGLEARLSDVA